MRKLVSSWHLAVTQLDPVEYDLCELRSACGQTCSVLVSLHSKTASFPKPVSQTKQIYSLFPTGNDVLQPNEWKGISFGLHFWSDFELTGTIFSTVHGVDIRNGLSFVNGVADLTCCDLSVVLHNVTNKQISIDVETPVI